MATTSALPPPAATQPLASTGMFAGDKYRGAVVEVNSSSSLPACSNADIAFIAQDLQLPPAFALPADEALSRAIELAYERDFSQIPVLDHTRKPIGYLDVPALKTKWEAGEANPVRTVLPINDKVLVYMTKFRRSRSQPYTVITPSTPLAELEQFLHANLFAIVTDWGRKFVLAVATQQDLDRINSQNFVKRRGM
ncbi:hypothetical protein EIP86_008232 [Pleurotus ostreatoroseus]|nr:hypothetical protein EIP86_008232 [Pleurotus ostreatoroseus]